jgi:hypothetical protein
MISEILSQRKEQEEWISYLRLNIRWYSMNALMDLNSYKYKNREELRKNLMNRNFMLKMTKMTRQVLEVLKKMMKVMIIIDYDSLY